MTTIIKENYVKWVNSYSITIGKVILLYLKFNEFYNLEMFSISLISINNLNENVDILFIYKWPCGLTSLLVFCISVEQASNFVHQSSPPPSLDSGYCVYVRHTVVLIRRTRNLPSERIQHPNIYRPTTKAQGKGASLVRHRYLSSSCFVVIVWTLTFLLTWVKFRHLLPPWY